VNDLLQKVIRRRIKMKKAFLTILQLGILYGIYYIGSTIQSLLDLSVPGSIIGMLILFVLLQLKVVKEKWLSLGAPFLLSRLPLLFLPATVGLINYLPFFRGKGLLSVAIVIVSTFMVMVISARVSDFLSTRSDKKKDVRSGIEA
jgi:holin-like protein